MLPRHQPDRIRIAFDDHRLVSNTGLILPATLALHLGLPKTRSGAHTCQWRRHVGPLWRRESVPPRVIGQRKGPRQLFRENVARTAEAADRVGN